MFIGYMEVDIMGNRHYNDRFLARALVVGVVFAGIWWQLFRIFPKLIFHVTKGLTQLEVLAIVSSSQLSQTFTVTRYLYETSQVLLLCLVLIQEGIPAWNWGPRHKKTPPVFILGIRGARFKDFVTRPRHCRNSLTHAPECDAWFNIWCHVMYCYLWPATLAEKCCRSDGNLLRPRVSS